ncbi:YajQ family cyclic di-GMP-binding protein [Ferroacidibacillus organovorans]|uniref:Nucleotide-binding protein AYW79_14205 n=1 Tax=Ferroacidibacillus organovorans TaxID=1765683 RepID=A0A853K7H2_9BACL|nr:YajQ family cyclic di-GMP-binding protein [Ferroacidibacillus organovorans]KYP79382.1 YajQ family cyclic di-GMP-binding protein [Ferroacidibacillus organovorans]OAG90174.1 YajQ family cyclic di-GMP-binding protein [Ferroacidibacillus organovorans]
MAKESSFDVVSKPDMQEVANAVNQSEKELETRFDFKGSKSAIAQREAEIVMTSDDEYKLSLVLDIIRSKLIKRGVSLKFLEYGKLEPAAGGMVRQVVTVKTGIDSDVTKQIVKVIKDSKIKVTPSIQGDQVRVTGKDKDDLQAVISLLRKQDLSVELQFTNYR